MFGFFRSPSQDGVRQSGASPSASDRLAVDKIVRQFDFVDRSYALGVWRSDAHRQDVRHDLALMLAHGDLAGVKLELLTSTKEVLARFDYTFTGRVDPRRTVDSARGIELPLIPRHRVEGHRLVVSRRGRDGAYKDRLRSSWGAAEPLRDRVGSEYASEHARRISGGRQSGTIRVGREARHDLVVTNAGAKGYAFARDLTAGLDGVFVHLKFVASGGPLQVGDRLSALVVQTPRGVQARDVRRPL